MKDYLQKEVELIEDYGDLPKGIIGLCTADLPEDGVFAVMFRKYGWITFKDDKNIKSKLKIIER